jgi:hypothetical protein
LGFFGSSPPRLSAEFVFGRKGNTFLLVYTRRMK